MSTVLQHPQGSAWLLRPSCPSNPTGGTQAPAWSGSGVRGVRDPADCRVSEFGGVARGSEGYAVGRREAARLV